MAVLSLHEYMQVSGRNIPKIAQETGLFHQQLYRMDPDKTWVRFDARSDKIKRIWRDQIYYIAPDAEGVNNESK